MSQHRLKNGNPAHDLTQADRSKAGKARAENIRKRREEAEQLAIARLSELVDSAIDALADVVVDEKDAGARLRATDQILDRVLGRALQRTEHSGSVGLELEHAAEQFDSRLTDRLARRRAARTAGNGDG